MAVRVYAVSLAWPRDVIRHVMTMTPGAFTHRQKGRPNRLQVYRKHATNISTGTQ